MTVANHAETMGVVCPSCGATESAVYYTRCRPGGIVRMRRCPCGRGFQTRETVIGSISGTALRKLNETALMVVPLAAIIGHGHDRAES